MRDYKINRQDQQKKILTYCFSLLKYLSEMPKDLAKEYFKLLENSGRGKLDFPKWTMEGNIN